MSKETSELVIEKSKKDLSRIETIIGSKQRLEMLANDIIEEYAFYEALAADTKVLKEMQDAVLIEMAQGAVDIVIKQAELMSSNMYT